MSTISGIGKVAYVYNQPTDTWHPVAGYTNTAGPFSWSGTHSFLNTVTFDSVLNSKAGVNNFLDPAARDLAIPSPVNGATAFIRQTNAGAILNQIQYFFNGAWRIYGDNTNLLNRNTSSLLSLTDAGRTIDLDSSSAITVSVPTNAAVPFLIGTQIAFIQSGAGQVSFIAQDSSVILLSKNSNRKIAARYSPATLIKKDTNTWILIGDLTA
jgi:hypothetical protein